MAEIRNRDVFPGHEYRRVKAHLVDSIFKLIPLAVSGDTYCLGRAILHHG